MALLLTISLNTVAQTDPKQDKEKLPGISDTSIQNQFPAKVSPAVPATPETMPMDTLHNKKKIEPSGTINAPASYPASPKLTESQMKAVVGKDEPAGTDSLGRKLYKGSDGRKYYVNDEGAKVFVK